MRQIIFTLIVISIIIGCDSKPSGQRNFESKSIPEETGRNEKPDKEYPFQFPELPENGFVIKPKIYSVKFRSRSLYKSDSIEFDVYAEIDTTGNGQIKQITFYHDEDSFDIRYFNYPIFSIEDIVNFEKGPKVYFEDYNFDDFPDVAIHNREASGVKNQMYTVYLYNSERNKYYKNKFLSKVVNPSIDYESKTLTTFGQGGMASQIYSKKLYRWNNGDFELIKYENQTYSDSLNRFIRTTKTLEDSGWTVKVDTLKDELTR
ncbi:XAC2610-related protein [Mangrovivirga cuniculi]|uniref:Lipoprotein n=1 Tax=Mangrovivirga cuniculi TaxID=2715131 RepID=A0A4D7JY14_9BACT|nr:hypothetical protein [Mangrovivirga cuniculi]QCK15585.1 hypothetical protein DCC35_12920 [Mangrovivirga cuniculi]